MLTTGQIAPDFSLPDADLQLVSLSGYRDKKNVVLFFYPKDNTTGCTIEAVDFTEMIDDFKACNTVILGINKDSCESHADFRDQHGLAVRLLTDIDDEVCRIYGVWREKEVHGETKMGVLRSTFFIDTQGVIQWAQYDVKPKGHAEQVLNLVRTMADPIQAA